MNKFIEKIKTLKSIKADEGFKFNLRKKIIEEAGSVTNLYAGRLQKQQGMSTLQFIISNLSIKRKNMLIPLILIIGLLGGGAGATYASQSSLPGDVLYPVKIATEKAQAVLVIDEAKKADLHLQFSSERLEEVEELVKRGDKNPERVKSAVGKHKEELAKAQTILNDVPSKSEQSAKIAQRVAEAVAKNKIIIIKVSKDFEDDDDILSLLEDAWDDDTEHNDIVTMLLLQDILVGQNSASSDSATSAAQTGTETAIITDAVAQKKVLNKIAETNHKISEAERYIAKKELKGIDVAQAKAQVAVAKTLLTDAQNLLGQNKYSEAFLKAKEAHRSAQIAKELAENEYKKEKHDDEYDEDDEVIFLIPSTTSIVPAGNTNQNSNASTTNTTNLNSNNSASPTPVIIITDDGKNDNHNDDDSDRADDSDDDSGDDKDDDRDDI